MVIQSEVVYPGYGYPQQSYVTNQQQSWYATDGHHNNGHGMHPIPGPHFTTTPHHLNHHTNFDSTHSPQHGGWHGQNKHPNGGYGTSQYYDDGSNGQALSYNCDNTSPYPYNNKLKNDGYGTTQYYNNGSSGQALPYNCDDTSPYPYNNNKLKNGAEKTEYHTNHESSNVSMAETVVEPMRYEYDYSPGVLTKNPYNHGPQNGYKKVEWTVKGIDN